MSEQTQYNQEAEVFIMNNQTQYNQEAEQNQLTVTYWQDVRGHTKKEKLVSWTEFCEWLQEVEPQPDKEKSPLIKLAKFGDTPNEKNCLRYDDNVLKVSGIEGDIDNGKLSVEEAQRNLDQANIKAVITTTHSHKPKHPRLRVFAPLSKTCDPQDRKLFVARLNGVLYGNLANESFTLSQSYFVGGSPRGEYQVVETFEDPEDGYFIDTLTDLDKIADYGKSREINPKEPQIIGTWKVSDEELEQRKEAARKDPWLTMLAEGKIDGYKSPSEKDFAFINRIAFYLGPDSQAIENFAKEYNLYREKWDREDCLPHGSHIRRDINKVLRKKKNFYKLPREDQEQEANTEQTKERARKILQEKEPCKEFDLSVLPTLLKNYVEQICKGTEANPLMILTSVLGTISSHIGEKCYIPKGEYFSELYPNLWTLTIAPSGSFKTTALKDGMRIVRKKEVELNQEIYNLKMKKPKKKEDKEEIDEEIENLKSRRLTLPQRMTVEGMLDSLSYERGGMIPVSEFGEWLSNLEKSYNQGIKPLLADLFDVPPHFEHKTKTEGQKIISYPFITIVGFSTMEWVQSNISLSDVGSGFFARFLLFYPPQREEIPSALPKERGSFDHNIEDQIIEKLNSVKHTEMRLDSEAAEYFRQVHTDMYQSFGKLNERDKELIQAYIKRWSPYILKLAIIFQVLINPEEKISVEAIKAGTSVVRYAMRSTIRLFQGQLGESKTQQDCRTVLEFIAKKSGKVKRSQLLSSKILNGGSKHYDDILNTLEEQDKIITIKNEFNQKKYETIQLTENTEFE